MWTLILHDNEETLVFLTMSVKKTLPEMECRVAANIEEARELLALWGHGSCKLIVASLTPRLDSSHVPDPMRKELTGLDFVRDLRDRKVDIPALLFGVLIDTERAALVTQVPNVRVLVVDRMFSELPEWLSAALGEGLSTPKYRVDVDIFLLANQQCRWRMKGPGGVEDADVMDINKDDLDLLRGLSRNTVLAEKQDLRRLGLNVYKVLMADALKSGSLELKLKDCVHAFGGLSVARIRFNVDQSTHLIHLETLAAPLMRDGDPEFWMLKTPMFRKFADRGGRYPLFKDRASREGKVNCLVVEGKTARFSVGAPIDRTFRELKGARDEVDWLDGFLRQLPDKVGEVKTIRYSDQPEGEFAAVVERELSSGRFALVHFAGHSFLAPPMSGQTAARGFLLLGGHDDDVLPIEQFSAWAKSIQFVFLSSCESAGSQFIMRLVETEVPAVAGFAWEIDDAVAQRFSRTFYESLFGKGRDNSYLEYSFMHAKRDLHRAYPDKAHWVAPLLFMQVFDTEVAAADH